MEGRRIMTFVMVVGFVLCCNIVTILADMVLSW